MSENNRTKYGKGYWKYTVEKLLHMKEYSII